MYMENSEQDVHGRQITEASQTHIFRCRLPVCLLSQKNQSFPPMIFLLNMQKPRFICPDLGGSFLTFEKSSNMNEQNQLTANDFTVAHSLIVEPRNRKSCSFGSLVGSLKYLRTASKVKNCTAFLSAKRAWCKEKPQRIPKFLVHICFFSIDGNLGRCVYSSLST